MVVLVSTFLLPTAGCTFPSQSGGLCSTTDALYITEEFKSHVVYKQWTVTFLPVALREGVPRLVGSNSAGLAPIALLSAHWLCHSSCDSVCEQRALFMSSEGGKSWLKFRSFPLEWSGAADTHCIMLALSPWKAHLETVHNPQPAKDPLEKKSYVQQKGVNEAGQKIGEIWE